MNFLARTHLTVLIALLVISGHTNASAQTPPLMLAGNWGRLIDVAFSPDGQFVAGAGDSGSTLWNAQSGAVLFHLPGQGSSLGVTFSPNGKWVAAAGTLGRNYTGNGTVTIWNTADGKTVTTIHCENTPFTVRFSPDGARLLVGNGTAIEYDPYTGSTLDTINTSPASHVMYTARCACYSPDGRYIATAHSGTDDSIRLWDRATLQLIRVFPGAHAPWAMSVQFSSDGARLLSTGTDGTAKIWDVDNGTLLHSLHASVGSERCAVLSADQKSIYVASNTDIVKWDSSCALSTVVATVADGKSYVSSLDVNTQNNKIVAGSSFVPGYASGYVWAQDTTRIVPVVSVAVDSILVVVPASGDVSSDTINIKNTGGSTLTIDSVTTTDSAITVTYPVSIAAGDSSTIVVTLADSSHHGGTAYLLLWTNDPTHPVDTIKIIIRGPSAIAGENAPDAFRLFRNFPNPFGSATMIPYLLPQSALVRLTIYTALGEEVATLVNGRQNAGHHDVLFNTEQLQSGTYFYRLTADHMSKNGAMSVVH